jgi:protein phosphatase
LIIVADGVGGHAKGDFASNLCIDVFREEFLGLDLNFDPAAFLEATSILTAEKILDKSTSDPEFINCGTTVSGFLIYHDNIFTLNIGDSRVYIFREGILSQITEDHSLVKQMVAQGRITEAEALVHPKRNIMTSAIGQPLEKMTISIAGPTQCYKNDILLACTDGVHGFLNDQNISQIIQESQPRILADIIVESALKSGSTDNITCCCIKL